MAEATLRITAQDATAQAFASVRRGLTNLQGGVSDLSARFRDLAIGGGLALFARDVLTRTIEAERNLNSLNATLRATGFAAGQTATQVRAMAESLARTTVFDDDDILAAANALLRFRNIAGESFGQALSLATDLATALNTDVVDAARQLGRALSDPGGGLRGLKTAGVALSDSQIELAKSLVETGKAAEAQRIVLDALSKSVGGAASGQNQGLYGASQATAKAYDNLLKQIGRSTAVQGTAQSFFNFLTQSIEDLDRIITERDIVQKLKGIGLFAAGFRGFDMGAGAGRTAEGRIRGTETTEERQARLGAERAAQERANEAARNRAKEGEELAAKRAAADLKVLRTMEELNEQAARADRELVEDAIRLDEERVRKHAESLQQEFEREQAVAQSIYDFKLDMEEGLRRAEAARIEERAEKEREATEAAAKNARELGLVFESAFENALLNAENMRDVIKGLLQDIARVILRRTVTEPVANLVSGALSKVFTGFATGGSFTVGGAGGVDSQLVAFRATPGENVSVTRPGDGSAGGETVNVYVDARGADRGVDLRIEGAVRRAVAESVAAVRNLRRRRGE